MGTHDTLPTYVNSTKLSAVLASNPEEYLSSKVLDRYPSARDGHLPFLFKVLSIGKALSVQAHPDKELAEQLHRERGDVYKGKLALQVPLRTEWRGIVEMQGFRGG